MTRTFLCQTNNNENDEARLEPRHSIKDDIADDAVEEDYSSSIDESDYDSSSSSSASSLSDWDESLVDIEDRANEFAVVGSTPAFAAMVFDNMSSSKLLVNNIKTNKDTLSSSSNHSRQMLRQPSIVLEEIMSESFNMRRSESDVVIQSSDYNKQQQNYNEEKALAGGNDAACNNDDESSMIKPDDYLGTILSQQGLTKVTYEGNSLKGFFLEMGPENVASYDIDIATAARVGNLEVVKKHHQTMGKTLQCCNKFHESIIHTICRRGHAHILKYILEETNVSIQVRCDYGRTILHDAAWMDQPNFDLIKMILQSCPDLLYIKDSRGYTPLAYVGKQRWTEWRTFLEENKELVIPKVLT